ncbi:hypothetical protein D3C81_1931570 [compost metagenome]
MESNINREAGVTFCFLLKKCSAISQKQPARAILNGMNVIDSNSKSKSFRENSEWFVFILTILVVSEWKVVEGKL